MTVEAIKAAIEGLPEPDRRNLAEWPGDFEERAWDEEIARDSAPGGRAASLVAQVRRGIAAGKARPMEEGFATRRKSRRLTAAPTPVESLP
ncbi:MAG: hypothetical protein ABSC23_11165 [Bryobacteraceae bacterium]|jgi:hypothetical protein